MGLNKVIKIHPKDNVLVALTNLIKGDCIQYKEVNYLLKEDIEEKHKFFIQDLSKGDIVIMYGITVGKIIVDQVLLGERMSGENTKHEADAYAYRGNGYSWQGPNIEKYATKTFNG
jgi:altronate hydrolase